MSKVRLSRTYKEDELTHVLESMVVPDQWSESRSTIHVEGSGIRIRDIKFERCTLSPQWEDEGGSEVNLLIALK